MRWWLVSNTNVPYETRLSIVPIISNKDIDIFVLSRHLVYYSVQKLIVHVHSINVIPTFQFLAHYEMHPLVDSKFRCHEKPVTDFANCKTECKLAIFWKDCRDTWARATTICTCCQVQDACPTFNPFGWLKVEGDLELFWQYCKFSHQSVSRDLSFPSTKYCQRNFSNWNKGSDIVVWSYLDPRMTIFVAIFNLGV